jgi:ABC-type antimicrobial peptide transport system permease subunit
MLAVARSRGDEASRIASSVRRALGEVDPEMAISDLRTLEASARESISAERYGTLLLSVLAGVALTLSAIGIYSVTSYAFQLRRREMGIRMALGATPANLYGLVFRHGFALTLAGLALGLIGAAGLTRSIEALLFETSHADTTAWALVVGVVVVSTAVACLGPARRAAGADPTLALRAD